VGGEGDGAYAVAAAGVLRLGGEELVFGYLADGVDGQAGGLDRRLVNLSELRSCRWLGLDEIVIVSRRCGTE